MRVARTSRKMREMVYDDTRWVIRLRSMGVWDEAEAKKRFEDAVRRRREAAESAHDRQGESHGASSHQHPQGQTKQSTTTLFDATAEQQSPPPHEQTLPSRAVDGFETLSLETKNRNSPEDPTAILDVFKNVRSMRGFARQEYGKIHGALAPFYYDLIQAKSHADPIVFKVFRDPERQAQMLANLQVFSKGDWVQGSEPRERKLTEMMGLFESAVLREFEQGYELWDIDGRMKRYATVLHHLNGGIAGVNLYIDKHPIFNEAIIAGARSTVCLNPGVIDGLTLDPSRMFLEELLKRVNEQSPVIERIFPKPIDVFWTFVDKVREDILSEYCTSLFEAAHQERQLTYLKAVAGVFEQCIWFFRSLAPPGGAREATLERAKRMTLKIFELHIEEYLREELEFFTKHAEAEVREWDKKLSEQDASAESFYMGNFNRQADKKDFLSSFRKVVMLPVSVLPTIPLGSPFATSKPTSSFENGSASISPVPSRPHTPGPAVGMGADGRKSPMPHLDKAPTDELAAKAALMATRLEGIKSLFSIEVALNLVHTAKTSIGRASNFIVLGGQAGEEAREQCANIFVVLLKILGSRHVQVGFDKAIDHLSHYNPRAVSDHSEQGVAPLVTFIELVNVGDLISQMIEVFYEQQLAASKIADKKDFLDPAGRAKTKFEKMLDENVAAGLNKGIDVLMDEVEYLNSTTQLPTDYNPASAVASEKGSSFTNSTAPVVDFDISPTPTAQRVVDLVSAHTRMLVGTTEKTMLDVFNGEVGLRLFTAVCKHLKRQRISTDGAIKLIADMNLYSQYIRTLRNPDLLAYFGALRELSQIYLIDARGHAKEMATVIADGEKFGGVFRAEEVYEFAQRRADWYSVRREVERAMYGLECLVM
jgi:recyclin-1